ncbi:MAG: hypothetical protein JHC95_22740 [Solirubrobacteraceae bacterium]|nr:hypothetical protein [Solirubrobacteraceae bacterium]
MRVAAYLVTAGLMLQACGSSDTPDSKTAAEASAACGGAGAQEFVTGSAETAADDARTLQERFRVAGVTGVSVGANGASVCVVAPAGSRDAVAALTQPGELAFYDWEPNVIGPDGAPAPDDPDVTGGINAGTAGALSYYDAVLRASTRPVAAKSASDRGQAYMLDQEHERVLAGPADQFDGPVCEESGSASRCVATIKSGTVVVQAAPQPDGEPRTDPSRAKSYVLADRVALTGEDLTNPEQTFDQAPGAHGEPIVTFDFTKRGGEAWETLTRAVSRRGAKALEPGGNPLAAVQHFAVVQDGRLISVPFIDSQMNPDGVDAADGAQIVAGMAIQSAQALAATIASGPLSGPLRPAAD